MKSCLTFHFKINDAPIFSINLIEFIEREKLGKKRSGINEEKVSLIQAYSVDPFMHNVLLKGHKQTVLIKVKGIISLATLTVLKKLLFRCMFA